MLLVEPKLYEIIAKQKKVHFSKPNSKILVYAIDILIRKI